MTAASGPSGANGNVASAHAPGGELGGRHWLGVEFRHLGALAAVAREGSFRRAAESLGYVQSAISGQIAHLERAVGAQLVERSSGSAGANLTTAGEVLLSHVGDILARFEAARADVGVVAGDRCDEVRVGVLERAGGRHLAAVLRHFAERFPDAEVSLEELDTDQPGLERLADGEIDLMITELPLPGGPYEYDLLARDSYVLLVASDSMLTHRDQAFTTEALAGLRLIVPASPRADDPLAARLAESGLDLSSSLRPRSIEVIRALVASGLGAAIVPSLAIDPDDPATTTIELVGALPECSVALVRHRERVYSEVVHGFADAVRSAFTGATPVGADEPSTNRPE